MLFSEEKTSWSLPPSLKTPLVPYLKCCGSKTYSRLWDALHPLGLRSRWNAGERSMYIFNLGIQLLHLSKNIVWTSKSFSQTKSGWLRCKQCITSAGAAEELTLHPFGINISKHSCCRGAGVLTPLTARRHGSEESHGLDTSFPLIFVLHAVWPHPLPSQRLQH